MIDQDADMPGTHEDWVAICNDLVKEDRLETGEGDGLAMAAEPTTVYSSSPLYQDNLLLRETFELSVKAIKFIDQLGSGRRWLIEQFESSACSAGANAKEAQNAESLKDFIHKRKIALKEADEAEYWYFVIAATHDRGTDTDLITRIQRVVRILNKIVTTSKQRLLARKGTSQASSSAPSTR
jgi:four helix bundle protein